jgi:ferredoxin
MKYLRNVATVKINASKCTGCGLCLTVCPHQVIKLQSRKAYIHDLDACMECGACKTNCPTEAIEVDAGVGCAYAIFRGMLFGTAPSCGCSDTPQQGCGT